MEPDRCGPVEALRILSFDLPTAYLLPDAEKAAQFVKRLQTLSDEDLTALSQSPDTFVTTESNRRLSLALRDEAARTTRLTRWVLRLTWGLVGLTVFLVILTVLLIGSSCADTCDASTAGRARYGKWRKGRSRREAAHESRKWLIFSLVHGYNAG